MNLQTLTQWVGKIEGLTRGGRVVLQTTLTGGLVATVEWLADNGDRNAMQWHLKLSQVRDWPESAHQQWLDRIERDVRVAVQPNTGNQR